MIIYLDFDGTVVVHKYPDIGDYNQECFEVIKKLHDAGHEIVLNTYRANCNDETLVHAVSFLKEVNLFPYIERAVNKKIYPTSWEWEQHLQKKIIFLDDICEGIPLKEIDEGKYKVVDWISIDKEFVKHGLYKQLT